MKKYNMLGLFFLIVVSTLFGTTPPLFGKDDNLTWAKNRLKAKPYEKTSQAFVLSYAVRYINGRDGAARYNKYVQFYTQSPESKMNKDTLIDLAVFPVVDYVVGYAMIPVKGLVYTRGVTQKVSPHALHFGLNNLQLATSAAITRSIHMGVEQGLKIDKNGIKNFGKTCATQVACDAVDEMVIQPLVQMVAGDDSTWTGLGTHILANIAFVSCFAGK